jgi:hypothetical protein
MADEEIKREEIKKEKIRRAMLAGPSSVTAEATVAEMDAHGNLTVLRPGTNEWVCIPGDQNVVGFPKNGIESGACGCRLFQEAPELKTKSGEQSCRPSYSCSQPMPHCASRAMKRESSHYSTAPRPHESNQRGLCC